MPDTEAKSVKSIIRNPPWTRDEIILALDLYFRLGTVPSSEKNEDIIKLSELLRRLPIYRKSEVGSNFRNPDGVYMKLMNIARLDPAYPGKGLDAGSKLEEVIWNEFSGQREHLARTAQAIRENYSQVTETEIAITEEDNDEGMPEGRILTASHKIRERNSALVARKKEQVLNQTGSLTCECCGFNFEITYGRLGYGFAECHHKIPVSELAPGTKTKPSDLAIVCANCHRMLHRSKPMITIEELHNLIQETKQQPSR